MRSEVGERSEALRWLTEDRGHRGPRGGGPARQEAPALSGPGRARRGGSSCCSCRRPSRRAGERGPVAASAGAVAVTRRDTDAPGPQLSRRPLEADEAPGGDPRCAIVVTDRPVRQRVAQGAERRLETPGGPIPRSSTTRCSTTNALLLFALVVLRSCATSSGSSRSAEPGCSGSRFQLEARRVLHRALCLRAGRRPLNVTAIFMLFGALNRTLAERGGAAWSRTRGGSLRLYLRPRRRGGPGFATWLDLTRAASRRGPLDHPPRTADEPGRASSRREVQLESEPRAPFMRALPPARRSRARGPLGAGSDDPRSRALAPRSRARYSPRSSRTDLASASSQAEHLTRRWSRRRTDRSTSSPGTPVTCSWRPTTSPAAVHPGRREAPARRPPRAGPTGWWTLQAKEIPAEQGRAGAVAARPSSAPCCSSGSFRCSSSSGATWVGALASPVRWTVPIQRLAEAHGRR